MDLALLILLLVILALALYIASRSTSGNNQQITELVKDLLNDNKLFMVEKNNENFRNVIKDLNEFKTTVADSLHRSKLSLTESLAENTDKQNKEFNDLKEKIQKDLKLVTDMVETKLNEISGKVEEKLSKGFEKTNETFLHITERLIKIDEAQKKIEALSRDVGSLQNILTDKKTRGIFGEVQLNQILIAIFGEHNEKLYSLQKQLGNNGVIADAVLYLPDPLGTLPVDSKFPMENYERMVDSSMDEHHRDRAKKEFKTNIKKHINDIADKYIIPGETTQAIMFLPAEAVFSEIHAYHEDLVELARSRNVWMASPSTFMALLTTIQSVLRNIETQKQARVIQEELIKLSQEFGRYRTRWGKLSQHIEQVSKDVKDINVTTEKITTRFSQIENVEIEAPEEEEAPLYIESVEQV
ncbi:MAG: DNA recombination protein RmuC [Candidatus Margulisiibacteriota bacterium]